MYKLELSIQGYENNPLIKYFHTYDEAFSQLKLSLIDFYDPKTQEPENEGFFHDILEKLSETQDSDDPDDWAYEFIIIQVYECELCKQQFNED